MKLCEALANYGASSLNHTQVLNSDFSLCSSVSP